MTPCGHWSFFNAFKIVAWKFAYYVKKRIRLQRDGFVCGYEGAQCHRAEKQWNLGCPLCELTEARTLFLEPEIEREIRIQLGGWPKSVTRDRCIEVAFLVMGMLADSNDKILGSWDVFLAECARIYRAEWAEARMAKEDDGIIGKPGANAADEAVAQAYQVAHQTKQQLVRQTNELVQLRREVADLLRITPGVRKS